MTVWGMAERPWWARSAVDVDDELDSVGTGRRRQKRSVDFRLGLDGGKRQTIGGENAN